MVKVKIALYILVVPVLIMYLLPGNSFCQESNKLTELYSLMEKESEFFSYIFKQPINAKGTSAIVVAPTKDFPFKNINSIGPESKMIGTIILAKQFAKYSLAPGSYAILLKKLENVFFICFVNGTGTQAGPDYPATVRETKEKYEEPIVEIVFNSPGILFCWDNICVEI